MQHPLNLYHNGGIMGEKDTWFPDYWKDHCYNAKFSFGNEDVFQQFHWFLKESFKKDTYYITTYPVDKCNQYMHYP